MFALSAAGFTKCHRTCFSRSISCGRLENHLKNIFFRATAEIVLLSGEAQTLTSKRTKELTSSFTKMLRNVRNMSWKVYVTNHFRPKNVLNKYCHLDNIQ